MPFLRGLVIFEEGPALAIKRSKEKHMPFFLKKPNWMRGLADKSASNRSSIKKQCSIDAVQDNGKEDAQSAQRNEQNSKPSWAAYLSKRKRSITAAAASLGIVVAVTLGAITTYKPTCRAPIMSWSTGMRSVWSATPEWWSVSKKSESGQAAKGQSGRAHDAESAVHPI